MELHYHLYQLPRNLEFDISLWVHILPIESFQWNFRPWKIHHKQEFILIYCAHVFQHMAVKCELALWRADKINTI